MGVGDSLHNSGLIATLNKSGVAGTLYAQNGNAAARPCSDSDNVPSGLDLTADQVYLHGALLVANRLPRYFPNNAAGQMPRWVEAKKTCWSNVK